MSDSNIFISHQTQNKEVAQIIVSLLEEIGIPTKNIFCSSSPGNDVKYQISEEVFNAINKSDIDIVILSEEYYKSPFCLNEAGIIWFKRNIRESKVIAIALPEIHHKEMAGFINGDYIQYDFRNENDICKFIDIVSKHYSLKIEHSRVNKIISTHKQHYSNYVLERANMLHANNFAACNLKSDDEKILLFYFIKNDKTSTSKQKLREWIRREEIEYFNLDNTIAILQQKNVIQEKDVNIELSPMAYAEINSNRITNLINFKRSFEYRRHVSSILFDKYWREGKFSEEEKLLFAFFTEKNILDFTFPFDDEITQDLKSWECKYNIDTNLEKKVNSFVKEYIENEFFQISRTNGKYTYYHISSVLLAHIRKEYFEQINTIKKSYDINDKVNEFHCK